MTSIKSQLIDYFRGKLPEEKKPEIEEWLSNTPDQAMVEECLQLVMEEMPAEESNQVSPATLAAYNRFLYLTKEMQQEQTVIAMPAKHHISRNYTIAAAAIIILIATATIGYWLLNNTSGKKRSLVAMQKKQYQAVNAAITHIRLPDGTQVRLFPGSTLTVEDSFNITSRVVALKGRGYFEVAHNPACPFYVNAGPVHAKVLGTVFDVNMNAQNNTELVLKEGKVQISSTDSLLCNLSPGQCISINKNSGRWEVKHLDANEYSNWTTGELSFRQVPLKDILPTLELWFNVSFHVQRSNILNKKLTFFIRRQRLQEAMEVLSVTAGFQYQMNPDGNIIIK